MLSSKSKSKSHSVGIRICLGTKTNTIIYTYVDKSIGTSTLFRLPNIKTNATVIEGSVVKIGNNLFALVNKFYELTELLSLIKLQYTRNDYSTITLLPGSEMDICISENRFMRSVIDEQFRFSINHDWKIYIPANTLLQQIDGSLCIHNKKMIISELVYDPHRCIELILSERISNSQKPASCENNFDLIVKKIDEWNKKNLDSDFNFDSDSKSDSDSNSDSNSDESSVLEPEEPNVPEFESDKHNNSESDEQSNVSESDDEQPNVSESDDEPSISETETETEEKQHNNSEEQNNESDELYCDKGTIQENNDTEEIYRNNQELDVKFMIAVTKMWFADTIILKHLINYHMDKVYDTDLIFEIKTELLKLSINFSNIKSVKFLLRTFDYDPQFLVDLTDHTPAIEKNIYLILISKITGSKIII